MYGWKAHGQDPTDCLKATHVPREVPSLSASLKNNKNGAERVNLLLLDGFPIMIKMLLVIQTSAWIWNPEGGSREGRVAVGGSFPGHIHIIPSCSKHGRDLILTFRNFVDGIFSHFPSVEYSHPKVDHQTNIEVNVSYCMHSPRSNTKLIKCFTILDRKFALKNA